MDEGWRFMKLLYICEKWPNSTKPTWDWQINTFANMGYQIEVLSATRDRGHLPEISEPCRREIRASHYPATLRNIPSRVILNRNFFKLFSKLRMIKHVFGRKTGVKDKLIQYCRSCCMKTTDPDFVLIKNLVTAAQFTFLKQFFPDKAIAMYYHGGVIPGVPTDFYRHNADVFAMCDVIFTNTKYAREDLIRLGAAQEKICVVPVGIDLKKFKVARSKEYKRNSTLSMLTVSRIAEEKGIIHAVKAVERLVRKGMKQIKYVIVGSGPLLSDIQDYISSNELGAYIECVGHKANSILRETVYVDSDVLIVPSVPARDWEETQCTAIQEAGLMYIPAIATKTGGLPEVVLEGKTGYLVPPFDEEAISRTIEHFLYMPQTSFLAMGQAAHNFASTHFDIEKISRQMISYVRSASR
jgi:glycosyltransferase involved in cell wall biosynthesis